MGNQPQDEAFQEWLTQKHSQLVTPRELVSSCVQKAVGSKPEHSTRIIRGQDHEVYDICTSDGQSVIVRIAHHEDHRLEAEKWALDAARQKGVPTPKVLLLEQVEHDGKTFMFCIEEKLPGRALNELIGEGADISAIIPQLGEALGKIHSVHTDGFGYLQPNGKAWDITWQSIMLDLIPKRQKLLATATREIVPSASIDAGLDILRSHTDLYKWNTPVLNHGDFLPAHILVENGRITGVIDMQQCSGNHPIFDFAWWEAEDADKVPTRSILDNYPHKEWFGDKFELLLNLTMVRHSLWMLMVESDNGNKTGLDDVKSNLDKALRFFSGDRS